MRSLKLAKKFLTICLALFSVSVYAYDCNYDNVTAKPEDGYFFVL